MIKRYERFSGHFVLIDNFVRLFFFINHHQKLGSRVTLIFVYMSFHLFFCLLVFFLKEGIV